MSLPLRSLRLLTPRTSTRFFSLTTLKLAEGDTGSHRFGGQRDTWNKREKAAEDMYIKGREQQIMALLKEKIGKQEAALAKDRAVLSGMEDQYGRVAEGRAV